MSDRHDPGARGLRTSRCQSFVSVLPQLLCGSAAFLLLAGCASGPGVEVGGSFFGHKGAAWTILCVQLAGPDKLSRIEQIAQTLKRTPGIRSQDVFVREGSDGFARLYYSTFSRRTDRKTGRRSMPDRTRQDLNLLKELGTDSGQRLFLLAMLVRMPTPDVGNPEWDLRNVNATYSLQVGVFEPTDDFGEYKRAAAEFCALLREQDYQAYYHHSMASSVVTVGAFGPEAVITRSDGLTYYSSEVLALQREKLLQYNLLNGAILRVKNPQGGSVPVPSRLVEIPKRP